MMQFFRVTPPTVHQMVLALERAGLISRQPGVTRSIVSYSTAPPCPNWSQLFTPRFWTVLATPPIQRPGRHLAENLCLSEKRDATINSRMERAVRLKRRRQSIGVAVSRWEHANLWGLFRLR